MVDLRQSDIRFKMVTIKPKSSEEKKQVDVGLIANTAIIFESID